MRLIALLCLLCAPAFALGPTVPFAPIVAGTVSLTAGTSSTRVALTAGVSSQTAQGLVQQIQVYNAGATAAFIEVGDSTVVALLPSGATGGSYPVAPGAVVIFSLPFSPVSYVAAITASGSDSVYVTPGLGL